MTADRILDKDISFANYANFYACRICDFGKSIEFTFANRESYSVPLDYFLKWNSEPHYVLEDGKWVEWETSRQVVLRDGAAVFVKCERILSNTAVKVCLSNGCAYIVPWDSVLMGCERRYEHFGGLTEESRAMVLNYFACKGDGEVD